MRALIVGGPSLGLTFPLVPPAWALRAAGHEVLLTGPPATQEAVRGAGLPFAASTGELAMADFMMQDRAGRKLGLPEGEGEMLAQMGGGFARLGAYSLAGLLELSRAWRPDLVIGSTFHYAAPLLAGVLGVPWVNQGVELSILPELDAAARAELAPEFEQFGLDGLPEPAMWLDPCPPGLLRAGEPAGQPFRYVPFNTTGPTHQWMLQETAGRRVCVTLGSRVSRGKRGGLETLDRLVRALAGIGAQVVVAATEQIAAELGTLPDGVRAGWLPLDVVVPRCDLVVHHGGGNTMLSCLAAGVPQLLLPYMVNNRIAARRLGEFGVAEVLEPGADTDENVAQACARMLESPDAREHAARIGAEIAALPSPLEVAVLLEKAAAEGPGRTPANP